MKKLIIYFIGFIVLFVVLAHFIFPDKVILYSTTTQDSRYVPIPSKDWKKDSLSLAYHYANIEAHFKKPFFQNTIDGIIYRDDEAITLYYHEYQRGDDTSYASRLGLFCNAMINLRSDRVQHAYDYFQKLEEDDFPYYQAEMGKLYLSVYEYEKAQKYFDKALTIEGERERILPDLIKNYYGLRKFDELSKLWENPANQQHFPREIYKSLMYMQGSWPAYFKATFEDIPMGSLTLIAAFLVSMIWAIYLLQLDLFKRSSWGGLIFMFALGALFAPGCLALYNFFEFQLGFRVSGHPGNDFLYSIFGIGFIEELFKILPLLLVLMIYPKLLKEPIDYLLFACFSALGFAFSENLIYFDPKFSNDQVLDIVHLRGIISSFGHLFDTSLVAYGIMQARYKKGANKPLVIALFFFLAMLSHGFYDFWLINETVNIFYLYSYLLLVVGLFGFNSMANNALNHSPFFTPGVHLNSNRVRIYLVCSFTGLLLLEYLFNANTYGTGIANDELISSTLFFLILIFFLALGLSRFYLTRGYWMPFSILGLNNPIKNDLYIGKRVNLVAGPKSKEARLFPLNGTVTGRESFSNSPQFLHIRLDESKTIGSLVVEELYAKVNGFNSKNRTPGLVYLSPTPIDLSRTDKSEKEIGQVDSAVIQIENWKPEKTDPKANLWLGIALVGSFMFLSLVLYYYMNFTSARLAYYWAYEMAKRNDNSDANQNLKYALHMDEDYVQAYELQGKLHLSRGSYKYAADRFTKYLELEKTNAQIYYLLGKCQFQMKEYEPALSSFNQFVGKTAGTHPDSLAYFMARSYFNAGKMAESLPHYKLWNAKKLPGVEFTEMEHAKALLETQKYEEAKQVMNSLIQRKSGWGNAYVLRGLAEMGLKDSSEACTDFAQAHTLNDSLAPQYLQKYCGQPIVNP